MDDIKKPIRLVFNGKKEDIADIIKLHKEGEPIIKMPNVDLFLSLKIQIGVNGGYALFLEHTGKEPSDLYVFNTKDELISLLSKVLK